MHEKRQSFSSLCYMDKENHIQMNVPSKINLGRGIMGCPKLSLDFFFFFFCLFVCFGGTALQRDLRNQTPFHTNCWGIAVSIAEYGSEDQECDWIPQDRGFFSPGWLLPTVCVLWVLQVGWDHTAELHLLHRHVCDSVVLSQQTPLLPYFHHHRCQSSKNWLTLRLH